MNKHGYILTYIAFAIVGILLAYNTNFSSIEKVQANNAKPLDLPTLQFDRSKLLLDIDLEKGTSNIQSDMPVTNVDVTVNHPTKIVEKVVKQPVKERIIYETKTQYLEKIVTFPLLTPNFHVPNIEIPEKVEL